MAMYERVVSIFGARTTIAARARHLLALAGALALLSPIGPAAGDVAQAQAPPPLPAPSANVSVYATGLDGPRGLKFGPDGSLYVAEAGRGGTGSTVGQCTQVVQPVGPYTGSATDARISRIAPGGQRTTAVDNLPSSQTSAALGSLPSGVADVAFVGNQLYAVLAGAGCSHGVASVPNGVIRANPNGTWSVFANLSAFQMANPVANSQPADFEPDGTWYSLAQLGGVLYAVEPNHGELDRITANGQVTRVIDISASQGHVVPTAMVVSGGNFYVGTLQTFPVVQGAAKIYRITPSGQISVAAAGLTAVLGVAFDPQGRMYALETTGPGEAPTPGTGRVVRITPSGGLEPIATGLVTPTGMVFGPDGFLYVSNFGYGGPPGAGQIVRISVPGVGPAVGLPRTGDADRAAPSGRAAGPLAWLAAGVAAAAALFLGARRRRSAI